MTDSAPLRGEIWVADLNPVRGHEQAGRRPCLILSVDEFNSCPAELVIVLPITAKRKAVGSHVEIRPSESGLKKISFMKCEDIRSISIARLTRKVGSITPLSFAKVEDRVRLLLGL